jgi:hypothetical protein
MCNLGSDSVTNSITFKNQSGGTFHCCCAHLRSTIGGIRNRESVLLPIDCESTRP